MKSEESKNSKCLSWISDNDLLNCQKLVQTNIKNIVCIDKDKTDTCKEVIFFNKHKFNNFSPIFSYCLKLSNNQFYPDNKQGPCYYNNALSESKTIFAVSKLNHWVLVASENNCDLSSLHTWNPCTGNICRVEFEEKAEVRPEDPCKDSSCSCKGKSTTRLLPCKKVKQPHKKHQDLLVTLKNLINNSRTCNISTKNISLKALTVVENCVVFGFQCKTTRSIILVQVPYVVQNGKVLLKCNSAVMYYPGDSVKCQKLIGLNYENKKSRVILVTRDDKRTTLLSIKVFKTLKSLSHVVKAVDHIENKVSSLLPVGESKNLVVYKNVCELNNYNNFCYEILKSK